MTAAATAPLGLSKRTDKFEFVGDIMKHNQEAIFTRINMESWERKEYFLHYYHDVRCTYSVTINLDITEIYSRV